MKYNFFLKVVIVLIVLLITILLFPLKNQKQFNSTQFLTISGKSINLNQFKNKVILVKFWSIQCSSCLKQIKELKSLNFLYKESQNLEILLISIDHNSDNEIKKFVRLENLPFTVISDKNGKLSEFFNGIEYIPTTFILDKNRKIRNCYVGTYDNSMLLAELKKYLHS